MPSNFLDQLAEVEVPPTPPKFDDQLHKRLNRSLTTQQVIDLGLHAFPAAAVEFLAAVAGMISLTLTGKFPDKKSPPPSERL